MKREIITSFCVNCTCIVRPECKMDDERVGTEYCGGCGTWVNRAILAQKKREAAQLDLSNAALMPETNRRMIMMTSGIAMNEADLTIKMAMAALDKIAQKVRGKQLHAVTRN